MKKLLILFASVGFLATTVHASPKHDLDAFSNVKDSLPKTLTIDLGNLSFLTKKDIDNNIKSMTANLFQKDTKQYTVIIQANKSLKNLTRKKVKFEDLKYKAEIKGTYAEVNKELATIADVFIKLKSEQP